MQTTLLGLAIAVIIALTAALIGPYFIDWNQFRPQFEAEATRVIGTPVRVGGGLDARLLPTPTLRLRNVAVGVESDASKVRADKLDVEFSLSSLMRGEWRATELMLDGMALDLGLDQRGRVNWPSSAGRFNLGSLAIDRLSLTGRAVFRDAASGTTLQANDISFSGDVRALAGSIRGEGQFSTDGGRYPFRLSSGQAADGNGTRLRFTVDAGERPFAADLDGILLFDAGVPRFDGAIALSRLPSLKVDRAGANTLQTPWRLTAKIKGDASSARLEQLEATYGADDVAMKLNGAGDLRFGVSPALQATLSAKQVDADRWLAKESGSTEPTLLLSRLRNLVVAVPPAMMATQIGVTADSITLGGRPMQNFAADVRGEAGAWTIDRLEFRAPGATRLTASGAIADPGPAGDFRGTLNIESADPDALAAWLQGRADIAYRSQKPLRAHGKIQVSGDRFALNDLSADLDGGALEGSIAVANAATGGGSRFIGALKADRFDFDAASGLARALAGPQAGWPDEASLSIDVGRATLAGQELRPIIARIDYGPKTLSLERLTIGGAGGLSVTGSGAFDRINTTGKISVDAKSASMAQVAALIAPFAPAVAARLTVASIDAGASRLKLSATLDKAPAQTDRADARAVLDIDSAQIKGVTSFSVSPTFAAVRGLDLDALLRSESTVASSLSAAQGNALIALLGLDHVIASGSGPAKFEGTATGVWRGPLRLKAGLSGAGLDANVQGMAEPWASDPKASGTVVVRTMNIAPLLGRPGAAINVSLSSRLSAAGARVSFDDIDSTVGGSRVRGRVSVARGDETVIDGEIGMDTVELAPVFQLAIGAGGPDAAAPLASGPLAGIRGKVAFQALRGALPGGVELRPVSGLLKSDGRTISFEALQGKIGGGEVKADIEAAPTALGLSLNMRVHVANVEGTALRYRGLALPPGRASMQMTLASQGRSPSALSGALSGKGLLTLDAARISGLDARAFDAAIAASDRGQLTDDNKLKAVVEPVLSAGSLSVASAQIPFDINDGRLRVGATSLDAQGARALVSGGYDIAADQIDIRANLTSTSIASSASQPEIQVFAHGPPDAPQRTLDLAALSSWLAVRTIDRETRRLDSIERGEVPPPDLSPAILSPPASPLPSARRAPPPDIATAPSSDGLSTEPPAPDVVIPGEELRRAPAKARPAAPRPVVPIPPAADLQVPPLPPAIDVKPAPGVVRQQKPRPPLVLTPQLPSQSQSSF